MAGHGDRNGFLSASASLKPSNQNHGHDESSVFGVSFKPLPLNVGSCSEWLDARFAVFKNTDTRKTSKIHWLFGLHGWVLAALYSIFYLNHLRGSWQIDLRG
ncbi:hypothetical protein WB44_08890 [Synechococcus sp. WH 8020]|nr:hypothetical protein WB44_08890 [Synechococcus sp. WH 8020]